MSQSSFLLRTRKDFQGFLTSTHASCNYLLLLQLQMQDEISIKYCSYFNLDLCMQMHNDENKSRQYRITKECFEIWLWD